LKRPFTRLRGTLGAPLPERIREGPTFINTGRGAQVVEADLVHVLHARLDLTARLDVTAPELPLQELAL
jgi:phosphoglycerate dehydrogenase-like enzyme